MRKLLGLAAIAFMFVACSNSPEDVVKKCISATWKGDAKQVVKYLHFKSEAKKQKFIKSLMDEDYGKEYADKNGGVKSIKTSLINEIENVAKVEALTVFKNGEFNYHIRDLVKIDGTWYLEID